MMVRRPKMFRLALQCRFRQYEKVPNFMVSQAIVLSYSSGNQLLDIEIQYMFTLDVLCMQYLCVFIIHRTMIWITRSLMCPHNLLTQIYTHVCLYLFFKTDWLPISWRGRGFAAPFFIREGPCAPSIKSKKQHC